MKLWILQKSVCSSPNSEKETGLTQTALAQELNISNRANAEELPYNTIKYDFRYPDSKRNYQSLAVSSFSKKYPIGFLFLIVAFLEILILTVNILTVNILTVNNLTVNNLTVNFITAKGGSAGNEAGYAYQDFSDFPTITQLAHISGIKNYEKYTYIKNESVYLYGKDINGAITNTYWYIIVPLTDNWYHYEVHNA